jgi:hypothetical protein
MKNETEITNDLDVALADYRENADKWTGPQIAESNAKVKSLREDLNAILTAGANECDCGNPPIGIVRKNVEVSGVDIKIYEVGCVVCEPVTESETRTSHSAIGGSIADAVKNWNNGKYLTDKAVKAVNK